MRTLPMDAPREKPTVPRCVVCAQPAEKLKCVKCKTPYCSVACQTVDWKERGHKEECKRLVKANAAAAKGAGGVPRDKATTPSPSPKPKVAPPVVDGPARGRANVERARAAAAAATSTPARAPEPEHWMGTPRCPVCLEDWNKEVIPSMTLCCCKTICFPCAYKLKSTSLQCPLCRTPIPCTEVEELAMLRRNVENGISMAIFYLGLSYSRGSLGLVPSYKKAARLYQRAADLGDVIATFYLGNAYKDGNGVKLDKKKAVKYYRMAADRGHTFAQFHLGFCYHFGEGVPQDYAEAVRFFKLNADQGCTHAEAYLGKMYEHGDGVAQNIAEASRWYERAAAKGHKKASDMLAGLKMRTMTRPSGVKDRLT